MQVGRDQGHTAAATADLHTPLLPWDAQGFAASAWALAGTLTVRLH